MRYVTPKQSKVLSALFLTVLASSCSLKSPGQSQTLTIALPGANWAQNPVLKNMTDWMSLAWASTTTTSTLNNDPLSLSEFDCFAVNVNGPGINLDPSITCSDPTDAPAIFGGFVPNGNASIDLDVPAGPGRVIKILGVKSLIGCPNLHDMVNNGAIDFQNIGHFYEIGKTSQDIYGDATVTIKATYNSASPTRAFSQCKTSNEDNGSHLWGVYAGTGPGWINASKTVSGTSYVTGKFDYIGPDTHSGVILNQDNGKLAVSNYAHINGTVRCAATDGFGGYYVGGSINGVESTSLTNAGVIHILHDGSWDPNFVIKVDAGTIVNACLRDGTHLYLGGSFTHLAYGTSVAVTALGDFDLSTNTPTNLVSTFSAGANVMAMSMGVISGAKQLYVGGSFEYAGATHRNALALQLPTGTLAPWYPDPDLNVNAVYYNNTATPSVFLGGAFSTIQNSSSPTYPYLAQVDQSSGAPLNWQPYAGGSLGGVSSVNSIVGDGTYIYAALNGASMQSVTRFDYSIYPGHTPLLNLSSSSNTLVSLALSKNLSTPALYVGGIFASATAPMGQNFVAIQNPAGTGPFSSQFTLNSNSSGSVNVIVPNEIGGLFVGGTFQSIGGVVRNNLAAYNLLSGNPTEWNPSISGGINEGTSIASDGTSIYVGYKADTVHSKSAGVAKAPMAIGGTGSIQATTASPSDGDVNTIALSPLNDYIYAGGGFTTLGGSGATGLVKLQTSDLARDSSWIPTFTTSATSVIVNSLLVKTDRIYVGGNFDHVSATSMLGLAALNTLVPSLVSGWTSNTALNYGVQAITELPLGALAVATQSSAGGPALIKKIDPITGGSLDWPNSQNYLAPSNMNEVHAMAVSGGVLYIGGLANGTSDGAMSAYDLLQGSSISGFDPHVYNMYGTVNSGLTTVKSIEAPASGVLLIGGQYSQANVDSGNSGGKEAWGIGVINANTGIYY